MAYVLVLRNTDTKVSKIWEARNLYAVLRKATQFMYGKRQRPGILDEYILAHYGKDMSATEIAEHLSKRTRRRISKNAIVGRHHRLMRQVKEAAIYD